MMRSTFAGFTTATLALNASHRALEVTGQNIANINTPGYTRQRLDIKSLYLREESSTIPIPMPELDLVWRLREFHS